jgi:uncharacterized protein (DUF2384 family)
MPKPIDRDSVPPKAAIPDDDPRRRRWAALVELAVSECGGTDQASRWLDTPKIALKGKTPIEAMATPAGCDAVEVLLRQLNE